MERLASAKLYCVAPPDVERYWPVTGSMIRRALDHTGLSNYEHVEASLFTGGNLLWIAADDGKIEAVAITELQTVGKTKICVIVACAGENRDNWLHLISQIEDYAKAEGCSKMRIWGRPGWERVLDGYARKSVILDKEL